MVKKEGRKKKVLTIIMSLIVIVVLIVIAPLLYFFGEIFKEMIFIKPSKPKIKYGEFPFELLYEYKGEQKRIVDTIICEYEGISFSLDGGNSRDWTCDFKNDDGYGYYYIDKDNEPDLYIVVPEAPDYYMGDKEESKDASDPYIRYIDEKTGTYYEEKKEIDVVDIKIIEWKPSEPIQNNFK